MEIIITGLEQEVPSSELMVFNHGRYEEIIQPLADLGYLDISDIDGTIVSSEALSQAIILFRKEYFQTKLLLSTFESLTPRDLSDPDLLLTARELSLLHLLTSLDGDFEIDELPLFGSQNIFTRVIHYRLNIMGLYEGEIKGPFTEVSMKELLKLSEWFSSPVLLIINTLGNIPMLSALMQSHKLTKDRVVYFTYQTPANRLANFNIKKGPARNVFMKQLKKNINKKTLSFKNFRKKVHERKPDFEFLKENVDQEINGFLLRLLQVRQWMGGYYLGKLDSKIGKMTFRSMLAFTKAEVEHENIGFTLQKFVGYVGQNYWVLNVHYPLKQMIDNVDSQQVSSEDLFNEYSATLDRLKPNQQTNFDKNIKEAWKDINKENTTNLKSKEHCLRRIYYGVKTMVKSLWRGIKRLFRFLARSLVKLVNRIKNLAKILFREIREGLKVFATGMKFLFGKRTITTTNGQETITTNFDFDCDAKNAVSPNANATLINLHLKELQRLPKDLSFALAVTAVIIKWVLALLSGGWPKLVIQVGLTFRKMIRKKLKKKSNSKLFRLIPT